MVGICLTELIDLTDRQQSKTKHHREDRGDEREGRAVSMTSACFRLGVGQLGHMLIDINDFCFIHHDERFSLTAKLIKYVSSLP